MNQRDLAAALRHLDRLACPCDDPHRLALESILLRFIIEVGPDDRTQAGSKEPLTQALCEASTTPEHSPPSTVEPMAGTPTPSSRRLGQTLRIMNVEDIRARAASADHVAPEVGQSRAH